MMSDTILSIDFQVGPEFVQGRLSNLKDFIRVGGKLKSDFSNGTAPIELEDNNELLQRCEGVESLKHISVALDEFK
jgi:hypothetical protein